MNLVRDITPKDTDALYDKGLNFAQDLAHSFGITSSIAASVGKRHMATYKRAAVNKQLNLRVITCLSFGGLFIRTPGSFDDVLKDRAQYSDPRINVVIA